MIAFTTGAPNDALGASISNKPTSATSIAATPTALARETTATTRFSVQTPLGIEIDITSVIAAAVSGKIGDKTPRYPTGFGVLGWKPCADAKINPTGLASCDTSPVPHH